MAKDLKIYLPDFRRINVKPALAQRYEVIMYGLLIFQEFNIKLQICNARPGPGFLVVYLGNG
jgi:hypothetical protein